MRRLIWVFVGRTCQKVLFLTSRLSCDYTCKPFFLNLRAVIGNDLVEFEEFLLLLKLQNCDRDQLVKEAFKVLDPSGTGVITSESLEKVCADLNLNIPKEELTEMVAKADPEGKGTVDLQG